MCGVGRAFEHDRAAGDVCERGGEPADRVGLHALIVVSSRPTGLWVESCVYCASTRSEGPLEASTPPPCPPCESPPEDPEREVVSSPPLAAEPPSPEAALSCSAGPLLLLVLVRLDLRDPRIGAGGLYSVIVESAPAAEVATPTPSRTRAA
jgi:hypothetical protein